MRKSKKDIEYFRKCKNIFEATKKKTNKVYYYNNLLICTEDKKKHRNL